MDGRRCGDADYLAAAGIAARTMHIGGALMRLESSGAAALADAVDAVLRMVKSMNARRRWRLNGAAMQQLAESALLAHMVPGLDVKTDRPEELAAVVLELENIKRAMQRRIERLVR